jgi:hypothetical protein
MLQDSPYQPWTMIDLFIRRDSPLPYQPRARRYTDWVIPARVLYCTTQFHSCCKKGSVALPAMITGAGVTISFLSAWKRHGTVWRPLCEAPWAQSVKTNKENELILHDPRNDCLPGFSRSRTRVIWSHAKESNVLWSMIRVPWQSVLFLVNFNNHLNIIMSIVGRFHKN